MNKTLKLNKEEENRYLNILNETLSAEYGSALEMLAACKLSEKDTFAYGYFQHSKDEYNHSKTFYSILGKYGRKFGEEISRKYRFNTNSLIAKGYLSREGYLIETMKLKDFIAYVYTNELLARDSFEGILKLFKKNSNERDQISQIMSDELRHHGLAEQHFLKYYPKLQPWQLMIYRFRESVKNKGRKFYDKNLKFLDKILTPLYYSLAFIAGKIIYLIDLDQFQREGKNLMDIKSKSII